MSESIEKLLERIRSEFWATFYPNRDSEEYYDTWIIETFTDYLVIRNGGDFFKVPFTASDSEIVFTSENDWTKVEQQYVPVRESSQFRILEATQGEKLTGSSWDIVVIGPDTPADIMKVGGEVFIRSKNGYIYSTIALSESVSVWEGVKVYDNHLTEADFITKGGMRSAKDDWLGNIVEVYWDESTYSVRGTFKVVDEGLRTKLLLAQEEKVLETIGLSIDAWVVSEPMTLSGTSYDVVTHIAQSTSVDLVSNPAAGGRILRAVAGITKNTKLLRSKEASMTTVFTEEQLAALKDLVGESVSAAVAASLPGAVTTVLESMGIKPNQEEDETPESDETPAADPPAATIPEEVTQALEAIRKGTADFKEMQAKAACATRLSEGLRESGLPSEFQAIILRRFENTVFETTALEAAIKEQREALMPLIESGKVIMPKGSNIQVMPITESDRYQLAYMRLVMGATDFEAFMTPDNSQYHNVPAIKHYIESSRPALPRVSRLSEWYLNFTEDYDWLGQMNNSRITEAAGTTTTLSSIVKNTMNLMLAADYAQRHQWWNSVVKNEDVDTLDQATLVRFHGLDTLSVVPEGSAYGELSLSDEEETAVYVKKGDFIGITLETFLQDKLGLLRRLPSKLSIAWYNTISKLVSNVFTLNAGVGPTLADSGALFNATALTTVGGHANLLTTAYGHPALSAVRLAMRKQTDQPLGAGERMNLTPAIHLLPADLETTAELLFGSELIPTQTSGSGTEMQSVNNFKGKFQWEIVPHWTDVNDWAAVADPVLNPAIWLIWLRGRRSPEVYTADAETSGAMFTHDTIRIKTRMFTFRKSATEDCAPVSDWRPLHKSNV